MADRFPKGIRRVVEEYGHRIQIAIDREVRWDSPLGCGSFGCVFPLVADPRRVLKLSTDATEGPVVKAIMETGLDKRLHGLARWDAIWRVPVEIQSGPRGTCWVILREDVLPYLADKFNITYHLEQSVFSRRETWAVDLRQYNLNARDAIRYKTAHKKQHSKEIAEEHLGQLFERQETYYLAEAIDELARHDIYIADVHQGNIGGRIHSWEYDIPSGQPVHLVDWTLYSQGKNPEGKSVWIPRYVKAPSLLMFDPGHSSAPKGEIPRLWEPDQPSVALGEVWTGIGNAVNEV